MQIFNFIGNIFGYLLWVFFELTKNYGVAIILFTVAVRAIMFPLSIKQQKSMAVNGRLAAKQKELQQKYANNKAKLNEEIQKLYQKEGASPMGGCLMSLLPLLLVMGVYYAVIFPLQNTLHIAADKVQSAISMMQQIPGVGVNFSGGYYGELEIVKHFDSIRDHLTMFSDGDIANISQFSHSFKFLGLDLLSSPNSSDFASMLWLIPVLCFVTSLGSQILTQKITGNQMQMQGCMKWMLYLMPLISVFIAYSVPAAVGFYWIMSNVFTFVQTVVINKFYSADLMTARQEAERVARRRLEEEQMKPLPGFNPKKLLLPEEERNQKKAGGQRAAKAQPNNAGGKKKNAKKKSKNADSYRGSSK